MQNAILTQVETETPELSAFDIIDQSSRTAAREEVRAIFAALGLSADTMRAIGLNADALNDPEDED